MASSADNLLQIVDQNHKGKPKGAINFAQKIHFVLSHKECRDAISWLPSGRSFCITSKEKFVNTILPKFFKSRASFTSFERRLKTHGFKKIDTRSNLYILTHETFKKNSQEVAGLEAGSIYSVMKQLRVVLSSAECQPYISWLPSGNSFCIYQEDQFVNNVLCKYFDGEKNFKNFLSLLKSKGFMRVGVDQFVGDAVYSHELFQIGRPDLCALISREHGPAAGSNEQVKEAVRNLSNPVWSNEITLSGGNPYTIGAPLWVSNKNGLPSFLSQSQEPYYGIVPRTNALTVHQKDSGFRCIHSRETPLSNQQRYFDRSTGRPSLTHHSQDMPRPTSIPNETHNSVAFLELPENQNDTEATYGSSSHHDKSDPCLDSRSRADIKLALLNIDHELLRVKRLKLLTMQRKLKVQLEMKAEK